MRDSISVSVLCLTIMNWEGANLSENTAAFNRYKSRNACVRESVLFLVLGKQVEIRFSVPVPKGYECTCLTLYSL